MLPLLGHDAPVGASSIDSNLNLNEQAIRRRVWLAGSVLAAALAALGFVILKSTTSLPVFEEAAIAVTSFIIAVAGFGALVHSTDHAISTLVAALGSRQAGERARAEALASLGHSLRTPLTTVMGCSEVMSRELFGPLGNPRYEAYCASIHEDARDLLRLVDEMVALSRIDTAQIAGAPLDVALTPALETMAMNLSRHARDAGIELTATIEPALPTVRIEPRALSRVGHALLHAGATLARPTSALHLRASYLNTGELFLEIREVDAGSGAHPERRADDGARSGRLSLFVGQTNEDLARDDALIRLMGGTLSLEAGPNGPARVCVRLPAPRARNRSKRRTADRRSAYFGWARPKILPISSLPEK